MAEPDAPPPQRADDAEAEAAREELAGVIGGSEARQKGAALGAARARAGALARQLQALYARSVENVLAFVAARNPGLWVIAGLVGTAIGAASVLFRLGIGAIQWLWTGEASEYVLAAIAATPWWAVFFAPVAGGLVVGLFNQFVLAGRRPGAVADVMEAAARGGRGLPLMNGVWSALATVISLGAGASAGREGPVIHLGATLATALTRVTQLPPQSGRIILACGAASAISASFNAPIAGVLFAHEVILRHYAISAFVPIVIASVAGTLAGRVLYVGDVAAFQIPDYAIGSYWEVPAFALLGVVAAGVAILFQFTLIVFDQTARAVIVPAWSRPVIGGFALGLFALTVPEVLGVGYEATDIALKGDFTVQTMLILLVAKIVATGITLASRFGGGIFSPALYLGAMVGGAFGAIAGSVFPDVASDHGLYAILGMGAVAAAILGAPVSTTMIVFELTGGYALSIALLLSVSIATGLHLAVHGRSFFHHQLETRGVVLADGPHRYFLKTVQVSAFMSRLDGPASLATSDDPRHVRENDTLETALRVFNETGADALAVVHPQERRSVVGTVSHVQALRAYNRRLVETSEEEHR